MRWMERRALCGVLWLAAAVCCLAGGVSAMEAALPQPSGQVACRYADDAPAFDRLPVLRRSMAQSAADGQAQGQVTAWTQTPAVQAESSATNASITLDALWIDGQSSAIWDWRTVRGALPAFDTARVCAIDQATALQMFGSTDAVGQPVTVDGIELTIACVFSLPGGPSAWAADPGRGLALCPAAARTDSPSMQVLDFAIIPNDGRDAAEWAEAWLDAVGFAEPAHTDALAEERRLLALTAQAPLLLLAVCLVWLLGHAALRLFRTALRLARSQWADRSLPVRSGWQTLALGVGGCALLCGLAVGLIPLAGIALDVPPDLLPSRWSDLSFWPSLIEERLHAKALRAATGLLRPDMTRAYLVRASQSLSLAAVPLLIFAWRALRQSACPGVLPRHSIVLLLAACAVAPLALLLMRWLGWPPAAPPYLGLLIPIFAAAPPLLGSYPPETLLTQYAQSTLKHSY